MSTTLKRGQSGSTAANETFQLNDDTAYTVATLPAAADNVGRTVYVSNGSAGSPCAAISDGTNWKVIAIGLTAAIA
jgi:hypothetical protein